MLNLGRTSEWGGHSSEQNPGQSRISLGEDNKQKEQGDEKRNQWESTCIRKVGEYLVELHWLSN